MMAQSRALGHRRLGVTTNTITLDFSKMADANPLLFGGLFVEGFVSSGFNQNIRLAGGLAYGTQTGIAPGSGHNNYDDSITFVRGTWGNDQTVTGTVHTTNQQGGGNCYEEVALQLRGSVGPNVVSGYENGFRMAHDGSQYLGTTQLLGIPGVAGTCAAGCSYISHDPGTIGPGIFDGDIVSASMSGTVITGKINGSTIWTYDTSGDSVKWSSGLPGFSHWYNNTNGNSCSTGVASDFGFTKIVITSP